MPAKGTRKKLAQTIDDLTVAQRTFVTNLTTVTSPTFGNLTQTFISTGLKYGQKPEASAMRLLANKNVVNVLCNWVDTKQKTSLAVSEINKEYVLQELRLALIDCKSTRDMTNRIRVLELFGKYLDLWSNKLTVSIEQSPVLSVEDRKYLAELSRLHLATGTPQLIEACFNANTDVSRETMAQDVVGSDNIDNQSSIVTVDNDTQVLDNTEDM
jgi:hypothetical protein